MHFPLENHNACNRNEALFFRKQLSQNKYQSLGNWPTLSNVEEGQLKKRYDMSAAMPKKCLLARNCTRSQLATDWAIGYEVVQVVKG